MRKIGFFDSGIGGLATLAAARKRLKTRDFIYYADTENAPFGAKTAREVLGFARKGVKKLQDAGAEIIVLACNTATEIAAETLRREYPALPIVGTEPAVKLLSGAGSARAAVLATPLTAGSEKFKKLLSSYAPENTAVYADAALAGVIEENVFEIGRATEYLENRFPLAAFDALVLGCTHYVFLRREITRRYPSLLLLDGNDGVARRLEAVAAGDCGSRGSLKILGGDEKEARYLRILKEFF